MQFCVQKNVRLSVKRCARQKFVFGALENWFFFLIDLQLPVLFSTICPQILAESVNLLGCMYGRVCACHLSTALTPSAHPAGTKSPSFQQGTLDRVTSRQTERSGTIKTYWTKTLRMNRERFAYIHSETPPTPTFIHIIVTPLSTVTDPRYTGLPGSHSNRLLFDSQWNLSLHSNRLRGSQSEESVVLPVLWTGMINYCQ